MITDVNNKFLSNVRDSARALSLLTDLERKDILTGFASLVKENVDRILEANALDLEENKESLSSALYQRLGLNKEKLLLLVDGILKVAELPDPLGKILLKDEIQPGLTLEKISVPLGVVALVFESRPDVIPQVVSLSLRSGNAAILKPGKEVRHTAQVFEEILLELAAKNSTFPKNAISFLSTREAFQQLLASPEYIDLVIPRGSNELVQSIMNSTKIPVLGHADGVCHLFIDRDADVPMAIKLTMESKIQYPAACNALETLLIDEKIAATFLPEIANALSGSSVKLYGCEISKRILPQLISHDGNWHREFGELELAIKIVANVDEAIGHINTFGSHHTDAIVTEISDTSKKFVAATDSACVFVNASTRFADGYRFGFGAEIGISTSRLHARGPVGLDGLVTYKYVLRGSGQTIS